MNYQEHEMVFQPTEARIYFLAEIDEEQEEIYVDVNSGYELDEKLRLFYTGNYRELFDTPVFFAEFLRIEYCHKSDDVDYKMVIGNDDAPNVELTFKTNKLQDENANKITLIREIMNLDKETENEVLRKLVYGE